MRRPHTPSLRAIGSWVIVLAVALATLVAQHRVVLCAMGVGVARTCCCDHRSHGAPEVRNAGCCRSRVAAQLPNSIAPAARDQVPPPELTGTLPPALIVLADQIDAPRPTSRLDFATGPPPKGPRHVRLMVFLN